MTQDQFTKLFNYMQSEFESTRKDIFKIRQDVQRVYEVVDGDVKMREIDEHERIALSNQVDRLEKRLHKLEQKLA